MRANWLRLYFSSFAYVLVHSLWRLGTGSRGVVQFARYAALVPASGMPVAEAAARVTARRSSGSMLWRRVLPAQRAIMDASPALALRMFRTASLAFLVAPVGGEAHGAVRDLAAEREGHRYAVADRVHPEADELGGVGARAHAAEPRDVDHLLLTETAQDCDGLAEQREIGGAGELRPLAAGGAGAVEHQEVEAALEPVDDGVLEAAMGIEVEAEHLFGMRPRDGHGVPALADPVHHPGRLRVRSVAPRLAELEPGSLRSGAACPEVRPARRGNAPVDWLRDCAARLVEARHEEGDAEIERSPSFQAMRQASR